MIGRVVGLKIMFGILTGVLLVSGSIHASGNWQRTSSDPVLTIGESGSYDSSGVTEPSYLKTEKLDLLFYTAIDDAGIRRIALATSSDGIGWIRYGVVLEPAGGSRFDSFGVSDPCVIHDNAGYIMYYTGHDGDTRRIGQAVSVDGRQWLRVDGSGAGGCSLDAAQDPGRFDALEVKAPSVTVKEGVFYMFYSGAAVPTRWQIGLAVSSNGLDWIRQPGRSADGSIFPRGGHGFDDNAVWSPAVIYDTRDGLFRMWYSAAHFCVTRPIQGIGYATSADGIDWNRHGSYLWRTLKLTFDSFDVYEPYVVETSGSFEMYYAGWNDLNLQIGRAVSVADDLDSDRPEIHFGNMTVGQSNPVPFEISNTGVRELTLTSFDLQGAGLTLVGMPQFPHAMLPGEKIPLVISCHSETPISLTGSLIIHAEELGREFTIPVRGEVSELALVMHSTGLNTGDRHELYLEYTNRSRSRSTYDFYLALQLQDLFYFFPDWVAQAYPIEMSFPAGYHTGPVKLVEFPVTPDVPDGLFTWWAALVPLSGAEPVISHVEFTIQVDYQLLDPWMALEWFTGGRDLVFLDVRSSDEFCEEHIPGAVHIPYEELESKISILPGDRDIVVYSDFGVRSRAAAEMLLASGFRKLWHFEIGFIMWGGPVEYCQGDGSEPG